MEREKHKLAEWLAAELEKVSADGLVYAERIDRVTMDGHFNLLIVAACLLRERESQSR